MPLIPFTQYLLPDGRQMPVVIEVSDEAHAAAMKLIDTGLEFECEVLRTGDVSLTITDPAEGDLDIAVVPNGPGMREAVEKLVLEFNPNSED